MCVCVCTLGAKEVTPLNMIVAYAQMVNGGRKIIPTFIDRIADRHGEMIYRSDNRICEQCEQEQYQEGQQMPVLPDTRQRVIDEVSAYQVVDMLRCVVTNSGTAPAVGRELDFPIAGKTGTTNDEKDAWFVGFTPDLVTAVYVGFDNPKSLGRGMTGGRVAAPIFIDFMKKINAGKEKVNFRKPEGNTVSLPIDNMGWPVFDGTGKPTIFKTDTEPNSAYGPGNVEDFISAGSYGPANTDYDDPFINENRAPSAISNVTGGIW